MVDHAYPVQLKRFPVLSKGRVVNDGTLAVIDGKDAYLEGGLAEAPLLPDIMRGINDQLGTSASADRIKKSDALMTVRVRSPNEMRATSYVVSALIVCFHGFGFEPQGNTHGRADFALSLISGADALKGF